MKSFITKFFIGAVGLALAATPLTASAAPWAVGIHIGGPGYRVNAGYGAPPYAYRHWMPAPYRYGYRRYAWAPAPPMLYEGYYGPMPGGYYGYYHAGRWFAHRRWGNGFWIYF